MRKVVIEEAANGYVIRLTKAFGGDIIESNVIVHYHLAEVKEEVTKYFLE